VTGDRALFSIVVPTRNRPAALRRCLESLSRLDYPRSRYEVIVVDDGGRPDLAFVTREFGDRMSVSLLRVGHAGPAAARNAGVAASSGDMLAFIRR
jgi:glycosyltransferase involved in cell wall biosynthesis